MFNHLAVIQLENTQDPASREAVAKTLRDVVSDAPGVRSMLLEPTLPGVYNGGDLLWRLEFGDAAACAALTAGTRWQREVAPLLADRSRIRHADTVSYTSGASGGESPPGGVYRVALFSVSRPAAPAALTQFAQETARMGKYIRTIRRWQLSRVQLCTGARPWTFVWEQEYADLTGLMNQYMMHPYHWAHIDRWFDPESTDWLVDPYLVHTFCATTRPVIGAL
jgi:hypothetical protein